MTEVAAPIDSAVLTSDVLNSSVLTNTNIDTTTINARRITLTDLKKVLQKDLNTSEVTVEQIKRVKMMHDKFYEGTVFNFNYNTLLIVASVIAALGLVSDSTATVIASMLVSPIMGPVVALAYGTTILDRKMVRLAWTNELVSLLVCIIVGVIVGAITGVTALSDNWPTDEMKSRCTVSNLLVGIPIAFFSGLGVAVSLLDDQTNSLVGVAISASLLPPAVNCGIVAISWYFISADKILPNTTHSDWARYAWTSLALTLVNIAMIWISSMLMFRLKEVLPIEKRIFWSDLGIARKIYQGKAVLAHQAFDPVESETAPPEAKRPLWNFIKANLHKIPAAEDEEEGRVQNDIDAERDQ